MSNSERVEHLLRSIDKTNNKRQTQEQLITASNVNSKSSISEQPESPELNGSKKVARYHLEETPEQSSVNDSLQFISPRI